MADLPDYTDTDVDATTGAPRWVKVFGVIALLIILLFVILLLAGGKHGPGRHTLPAGVTLGEQP